MLEKQPLTLEHPAVQAIKARWDASVKCNAPKHNLTFEELFEYFKADCVRQTKVAELAGVTRQRINQIYNKWFRDLCDNKSGWERVHACTLETRQVKLKRAEAELFDDPFVKKIVEKARAAGCIVETIPSTNTPAVIRGDVFINGYRCSLHFVHRIWQSYTSKRMYWPLHCDTSLGSENVDILVVHTEVAGFPERTFIIPTKLVRKTYGRKSNLSLYLPTEKLSVYRNVRPRLDWWQFEDAWHLLSPSKYSPAP